jgi:hypothetical protein
MISGYKGSVVIRPLAGSGDWPFRIPRTSRPGRLSFNLPCANASEIPQTSGLGSFSFGLRRAELQKFWSGAGKSPPAEAAPFDNGFDPCKMAKLQGRAAPYRAAPPHPSCGCAAVPGIYAELSEGNG